MNPSTPTSTSSPQLAVVLVTDCYATIRPVISCLRRQEVREQIEVVLVAPTGGLGDLDENDLREFAAVRRVEIPSVQNLPAARAAGVRAATAPVVFIGETHSFAQPGWAAALIRAHEGPWAVVVPAVGNASKRGVLSWAGYVMDYARWGPGRERGEINDPLVYNTAFKREIMMSLGAPLELLLDPYSEVLPNALARGAHRILFEPAARLDHLGVGTLRAYLNEKLFVGLMIGGQRRVRWPAGRCVVYFFGTPLVPLVLLWRVLPAYLTVRRLHRLPFGVLPVMLLGFCFKAAGEMLAYLVGTPPWVEAREADIEIRRLRYCPGFSP